MAFGWIGPTTAFGAVVRKPKTRFGPGIGFDLVPLRAMVDEAATALEALTPAEVNGWAWSAIAFLASRFLRVFRSAAERPRSVLFLSSIISLRLQPQPGGFFVGFCRARAC